MHADLSLKETQAEWHGTLKSYLLGFILSLILTCISFSLVVFKLLSGSPLVYALIGLALLQAVCQLLLLLHLKPFARDRWDGVIFYFMVLILVIVVGGTLWIMNDLDERMMPEMHMQ